MEKTIDSTSGVTQPIPEKDTVVKFWDIVANNIIPYTAGLLLALKPAAVKCASAENYLVQIIFFVPSFHPTLGLHNCLFVFLIYILIHQAISQLSQSIR